MTAVEQQILDSLKRTANALERTMYAIEEIAKILTGMSKTIDEIKYQTEKKLEE